MTQQLTGRQRRIASGRLHALAREQRERFYISFNCRGSYNHSLGKYERYAWPKLFTTYEAAQRAISLLPVFQNKDATHNRGRIVSVCVEKVTLRRRAA